MQIKDRVISTIPTPVERSLQSDRPWQTFRRGEFIPLRDGGLWQVCRGWVQLSTVSFDGRERVLGWLGSSMWLGNGDNCSVGYQAKALSDASACWYAAGEVDLYPDLRVNSIGQLAWRQRQLLELVAILQRKHAEERLGYLLLLLEQEMGQPVLDGTRLSVRLTHNDLANAIGSCRISVTRMLARFRQWGLVSWDNSRHLVIHDRALSRFLQRDCQE